MNEMYIAQFLLLVRPSRRLSRSPRLSEQTLLDQSVIVKVHQLSPVACWVECQYLLANMFQV